MKRSRLLPAPPPFFLGLGDIALVGGHDVEAQLGALLRAGDLDAVASRALQAYGPELYGFLINLMGVLALPRIATHQAATVAGSRARPAG